MVGSADSQPSHPPIDALNTESTVVAFLASRVILLLTKETNEGNGIGERIGLRLLIHRTKKQQLDTAISRHSVRVNYPV